jgi:hypothetical protein
MSVKDKFQDSGFLQRKYPRRSLNRMIGILCRGTYFLALAGELGEGGLSFGSEYVITEGNECLVSLQIPSGSFVFLRALVVANRKKQGDQMITHSLKFTNIDFSHKRQIRTFVSAQN